MAPGAAYLYPTARTLLVDPITDYARASFDSAGRVRPCRRPAS